MNYRMMQKCVEFKCRGFNNKYYHTFGPQDSTGPDTIKGYGEVQALAAHLFSLREGHVAS